MILDYVKVLRFYGFDFRLLSECFEEDGDGGRYYLLILHVVVGMILMDNNE